MKKTFIVIDVPDGWRYGFPIAISKHRWHQDDFDLEDTILNQGYPAEDIQFAMKHVRMWHQEHKEI